MRRAQHEILELQVTVEEAKRVAEAHAVHQLREERLDLARRQQRVGVDVGQQVATIAIFHD
eukprot:scaffold16013_cov27-Tisochrysis_lutea.AAC.3